MKVALDSRGRTMEATRHSTKDRSMEHWCIMLMMKFHAAIFAWFLSYFALFALSGGLLPGVG